MKESQRKFEEVFKLGLAHRIGPLADVLGLDPDDYTDPHWQALWECWQLARSTIYVTSPPSECFHLGASSTINAVMESVNLELEEQGCDVPAPCVRVLKNSKQELIGTL